MVYTRRDFPCIQGKSPLQGYISLAVPLILEAAMYKKNKIEPNIMDGRMLRINVVFVAELSCFYLHMHVHYDELNSQQQQVQCHTELYIIHI